MGADIHMFAEKRAKQSKKWRKVGPRFVDPYYPFWKKNSEDKGEPIPDFAREKTDQPYQNRNYDLFAILANVRNGRGFAGVDTGDGFEPIDMPRGIPSDASPGYLQQVKGWGEDGHSHSYFTVQELLDYDWHGQNTVHRGFLDQAEYAGYQATGKLTSWCSNVSGQNIVKLTERQYWEQQAAGKLDPAITYYVQVEWEESYYESAIEFVDKTLPALKALGDPNQVRVVFFFDN